MKNGEVGGQVLEKQQDQSVGFQAVEDCCWKGRGGSVGGGESQGDAQETGGMLSGSQVEGHSREGGNPSSFRTARR